MNNKNKCESHENVKKRKKKAGRICKKKNRNIVLKIGNGLQDMMVVVVKVLVNNAYKVEKQEIYIFLSFKLKEYDSVYVLHSL